MRSLSFVKILYVRVYNGWLVYPFVYLQCTIVIVVLHNFNTVHGDDYLITFPVITRFIIGLEGEFVITASM